jgi:hypothetical protein
MPRFQVDVQVYATAYVYAQTKEEAIALFHDAVGKDSWLEVSDDHIEVDPNVQLSPAMTSYGFKSEDVQQSDDD